MGSAYIRIENRKFFIERIRDEGRGCQVIAFIGFALPDCVLHRRIGLNRPNMQMDLIQDAKDSEKGAFRILNLIAQHQTVNFISLFQQPFCQIRPILTGNSSDQRFFHKPSEGTTSRLCCMNELFYLWKIISVNDPGYLRAENPPQRWDIIILLSLILFHTRHPRGSYLPFRRRFQEACFTGRMESFDQRIRGITNDEIDLNSHWSP